MDNEKFCIKCGKTKPRSDFYHSSSTKDGCQTYCKECSDILRKKYKKCAKEKSTMTEETNITNNDMKKVLSIRGKNDEENPLSKFSTKELITELRRRGFTGNLSYTYTVTV